MGKKVFIDCGAYQATSIKYFFSNWLDAHEYEIYSFEPNEEFNKFFDGLPLNVRYANVAVGAYDGYTVFYNNHRASSTTIRGKAERGGFANNLTVVPALNLSKWIDESFKFEDHIILKMDIEGAEYGVLRKMIIDGTIYKIDELYMEFHHHKTDGQVSPQEHVALVEDLLKIGLVPMGWPATELENAVPFHYKLSYNGNEHRSLERWPELQERSLRCIDLGMDMMNEKGNL